MLIIGSPNVFYIQCYDLSSKYNFTLKNFHFLQISNLYISHYLTFSYYTSKSGSFVQVVDILFTFSYFYMPRKKFFVFL